MTSPSGSLSDILSLEKTFAAEGTSLALETASEAGLSDGRALGWVAGAGTSAELSFYSGVAAALLSLPLKPRPRAAAEKLAAATELRVDAVGNSEDIDFDAVLAFARHTFQTAVALAQLRVRWDGKKPARVTDLDF